MANVNYYNFTPQVSTNQVVFGRAKELAPQSTFEFFVLSEKQITLPRWIRLGKWMAKAHVEIVAHNQAQRKNGAYHASGVLNPLDLAQMPENCNIVAMAPASLITNVTAAGEHYEYTYEDRKMYLPVDMQYRPGRRKVA